MKKCYLFLLIFLAALPFTQLQAQCSGGTSAGAITPTAAWQTVAINSGQYRTFAATAGTLYAFSFCQGGGSAGFDNQLTILTNAGVYAGGYSDDVCGSAAELTWTAPSTGTFRVLMNDYYCASGGIAATMAYRTVVPPLGANCGNPHIIGALPFTANGLTTCGALNDYASPQSCASSYMGGEDYVFRYVAAGPQTIRVTLSGTLTYTGVFVTQGCPDVGNCISAASVAACGGGGATNTNSAGNPTGDFTLPGAGTYFIFIDTWPSPTCTPFNINVQTIVPAGGGGPGCGTYAITTPAYNPDNFNSGTQLVFPDDEFSAAVPLPFTFCFMGTNYSQVVVSSNAYLSFNTACATQYSGWDTDVIPSPANANSPEARNSIMFPWVDVDPSIGGTIRYNTYGTAPNRRFVVSFRNIPMFSFSCNSQLYTGQATLYETTNVIDMYIQDYPNCPSWNNGEAVLGLFDASGTVAVPVPGYNNTVYSLSNFARRFTPSCPTCTTPLPVQFAEVSGEYKADYNLITWKTSHEINLAGYTLERSRDGISFENVGWMDATGTEPQGRTWQMEDRSRFALRTYYRVVSRDLNGTETSSEVIVVSGNPNGVSLVNAVVNENQLQLDLFNGTKPQAVKIELTDALGKRMILQQVNAGEGASTHLLDIGAMARGVYIVVIHAADGTSQTRRFVIQ